MVSSSVANPSDHEFQSRACPRDDASSCSNCDREVGSDSEMEMSCQSNGESSDFQHSCGGAGGGGGRNDKQKANCSAAVTGWMYVNQSGRMCGPYLEEQLYEVLSTGFLPEDLPVYPLLSGTGRLANSVPLKYFKQFPHHVATGFAHLTLASSATTSFHPTSPQSQALLVLHNEKQSSLVEIPYY